MMSRIPKRLCGTTLIEVVLVIAILGFLSLLVTARWPSPTTHVVTVGQTVTNAQSQAIRSFRSVTVWLTFSDSTIAVTALPSGVLIGINERTLAGLSRKRLLHEYPLRSVQEVR